MIQETSERQPLRSANRRRFEPSKNQIEEYTPPSSMRVLLKPQNGDHASDDLTIEVHYVLSTENNYLSESLGPSEILYKKICPTLVRP